MRGQTDMMPWRGRVAGVGPDLPPGCRHGGPVSRQAGPDLIPGQTSHFQSDTFAENKWKKDSRKVGCRVTVLSANSPLQLAYEMQVAVNIFANSLVRIGKTNDDNTRIRTPYIYQISCISTFNSACDRTIALF